MDYTGYVNKLNKEHEAMVQSIESVKVRSYIRSKLKKILNELTWLDRSPLGYSEEALSEMIAFNRMLVEAVEDYLKPLPVEAIE